MGTVFTNCYCGSTPCMPARRDIATGRLELLRRGWGPLEEEDLDLPRQVSGPPNQSVRWTVEQGHRVSCLITDHFHLWEQGAGNYHTGYTGFDFVRGCEADAWYTDPVEFACPPEDLLGKNERHWRNVHFVRRSHDDWFCSQVIDRACSWLERNRAHESFYLHLDVFDPHEPWDPPEDVLRAFDPRGYDVPGVAAAAPYAKWRERLTPDQLLAYRARYAAKVAFLDQRLCRLLDTMDRLRLWDDTLVIFTTDHGTYNGDHGRMGKLQTHEHDAVGHIPFILYHPRDGHGERREQLVQLVDIYPTVLRAVGKPVPEGIHGVDLAPALADPSVHTRDYAVYGQFGASVSITDGRWVLHQSPVPENGPLFWYGACLAKFLRYDLGPFDGTRREVRGCRSWPEATWLSDKAADPNELSDLARSRPVELRAMHAALRGELTRLDAPSEQAVRMGLG